MQVWHIWIIIGVGFFIWEIFTPGFFVASIGIGALAAALAAFFGASLTYQVIALAVFTLITFVLIRPMVLMLSRKSADPRDTNIRALIGSDGMVVETINNPRNQGRVKIGGEDWKALATTGDEIGAGRMVSIDRIEGVTVYVTEKKEI